MTAFIVCLADGSRSAGIVPGFSRLRSMGGHRQTTIRICSFHPGMRVFCGTRPYDRAMTIQ
jgi:hypothetical protein